ncbi:MAG: ABC transporter ATP-binding protein [Planctomycetes bacterium]|nr:ABC transporter ATP-binding protein [Planctomycetota bacterium]
MHATRTKPIAHTQTSVTPVIRAVALGKVIDEKPILVDLTFDVAPGEFLTLLGANGAGKSTLLKILATLVGASHGRLQLFGEPLGRDATAARRRLGMIAHGAMLYRDLSALENLVFFGRLYGLSSARDRARDLLASVDLADRAHDTVKTFSRGMTQRLSIARALMHDPEVLLADEPFAGLDAPSQLMLEQLLRRLHGEGRTIVLASHDLDQSLGLAERALVLRRGHMVMHQTTETLDARAVLSEIVDP